MKTYLGKKSGHINMLTETARLLQHGVKSPAEILQCKAFCIFVIFINAYTVLLFI